VTAKPIDPVAEYVLLGSNGATAVVDGGEQFWSQRPAQLEKFGRGWLVSEYLCIEDWPRWEVHPEADELVYVLEGDVELLLGQRDGVQHVRVQGRGLVIVHRGVWHTVRVHAPSRLLHVTMGAGTRHRPVTGTPAASGYQLAQLNIGYMKGPMDSPVMAEFAASRERINALADASPGFVWRLQTDAGDATAVRPFEDRNVIVNLSVWQDLDSLRRYVYESGHLDVLRRRREWFEHPRQAFQVLWWIPTGHRPTVAEAIGRLERLRRDGPGAEAFDFRRAYPSPDAGT
jgi:mannose-6-phosphate isomerase-like protein (cupin superfamily)